MLDALAFQTARNLQNAGRFEEARNAYRQVLARNPKHFESYCQLALMAFTEGRFQDALKENERALKLKPDLAGLHNNHGTFLLNLGRFKAAAESFERALRIDPRDAQARNNLGGALSKLGRLEEALGSFEAAIALAPTYAKAYSDRAATLTRLGRLSEAVASSEKAIALQPNLAEAHDHRGVALLQLGRYAEALASFDAAIAAVPNFAAAHGNRGVVLELMKRHDEALASLRRALVLDPDIGLAAGAAIHMRMQVCDWKGLAEEKTQILARIDAGAPASAPFTVLALPSSPAQQRKAAALYASLVSPLRTPARAPMPPRAAKIRIGYFSADFGEHPVGHAIAGVLERHDRARFEVSAFLITPQRLDAVQLRLRAAVDRFVDVSATPDHDVAAMARASGLDIAVDLTGYTSHARPGIFSYGVAPTQVAWLGYAGTLANDALPYLIADKVTIPDGAEKNFAEKIISLPHTLFPTDDRREIGETPTRAQEDLPESAVVFCSFNSAYKITPALFDVWMRILAAVEDSVLWLGIRNATAQRNLRAAAAQRGVDGTRIVFADYAPAATHLARHRLADLFLDTAPYGAHSTAADALQPGLPVLTMPGETFVSRVAASLLTSLGMEELIAEDWAAYERKAIEIGRNPALAARLRATLAQNLRTRPTFDTARFTRNLETAYATLMARQAEGAPPASFAVTDNP